jgi:hypothetical protein
LKLDIRSMRDCEPEAHTTLGPQEYLLGVEIMVTALTSQVPGNYYYASLRDSEGNTFKAGLVGCEPRLLSSPLAQGQTATGYANFRLPRSAKNLTLEYDPPLTNSDKTRGPSVSRKLGR